MANTTVSTDHIRLAERHVSGVQERDTTESVSRFSGSVFVAPLFGVKRNDKMTAYVSLGVFSWLCAKIKHYSLIHEQLTLSRFFFLMNHWQIILNDSLTLTGCLNHVIYCNGFI